MIWGKRVVLTKLYDLAAGTQRRRLAHLYDQFVYISLSFVFFADP
jgi:hypothetical protein